MRVCRAPRPRPAGTSFRVRALSYYRTLRRTGQLSPRTRAQPAVADTAERASGGYRVLMDCMRVNGLTHTEKDVIPAFETDGEDMDIYIACE